MILRVYVILFLIYSFAGADEYVLVTQLRLSFPEIWPKVSGSNILVRKISPETRAELEKAEENESEDRLVTWFSGS